MLSLSVLLPAHFPSISLFLSLVLAPFVCFFMLLFLFFVFIFLLFFAYCFWRALPELKTHNAVINTNECSCVHSAL